MRIRFYFLYLILLTFCSSLCAQEKKETKSHFNIIPYISYNSSLKFLYGGGVLYTFKPNYEDTVSPYSTAGATYIRSSNGTWYAIAFAKMFFQEDNWRLVGATGTGLINFQAMMEDPSGGEPMFFDYGSRNSMFAAKIFRKIHQRSYAGIGYFYSTKKTHFEQLNIDSVSTNQAIQFIYQNDSRNSVYYPSKGLRAQIMYTAYPTWMGNKRDFGIMINYLNKYIELGKEQSVLALRGYLKFGTKKLDFQRQVLLNGVDLRGYADGRYRGSTIMDIQAEYRWNAGKPLGLVGFGGLGTLFGSDIDDFNGKLYPSYGMGLRYLVVKSSGMRIGLDIARGKDDFAYYFRIGESF